MRTIVVQENLDEALAALSHLDEIVWDVETTGLSSFHNSKMFSLSMSSLSGDSWYFDFTKNLAYKDLLPLIQQNHAGRIWVAHNAKFDMHFCEKAGILPQHGSFVDTKALARLYENKHQPWFKDGGYSLDACAKRWLDQLKDDRVKQWMDENQAFETDDKGKKNYFFDLVPFEIISEYAMIDTEVTAKLYNFLTANMYETRMVKVESDLLKVLFHMEQIGLFLDIDYVKKARIVEKEQFHLVVSKLPKDFTDSGKYIAPILRAEGFDLPQTPSGEFKVGDDELKTKESDFASNVLKYRELSKRIGTYWDNFINLVDRDGVIHPTLDSAGTVTGRMSSYNPNFQNIPAEDKSEFPVRRAIVARHGHKLVSIDFKAMEFRMACALGGETELLEQIKAGHDPHQAAADLTGLTRSQAKTLNFAIIFGAGIKRIAAQIKCSEHEAKKFKAQYFKALPGIASLIERVKNKARAQGFVTTWAGRRLYLEEPGTEYKMPNHLIQGACSEITKIACVNIQPLLRMIDSELLLIIHDEVILEVPEQWLSQLPQIARIMSEACDAVEMACSIEVGSNLHDMVEYAP